MWNKGRTKQCENCENGKETHEQGEHHEVCMAGNCIYCFQCEKIDCNNYVQRTDLKKNQ